MEAVKGTRGSYKADRDLVLTRSCCFGLHTRLGSDFFPTDNDSDNDCWQKRNKKLLRSLGQKDERQDMACTSRTAETQK